MNPSISTEAGSVTFAKVVDTVMSSFTGRPRSDVYDVDSNASAAQYAKEQEQRRELEASIQSGHFETLSGTYDRGATKALVVEALNHQKWEKLEQKLLDPLLEKCRDNKQLKQEYKHVTRLVRLEGKDEFSDFDRAFVQKMKVEVRNRNARVVAAFEEVEHLIRQDKPFSWQVLKNEYPLPSEFPLPEHWRVRVFELAYAYFDAVKQATAKA